MPAGAVIFTVSRMVHVLPGRMTLFSLQTTGPLAPTAGVVQEPNPSQNVIPDSGKQLSQ